MLSKDDKVKRKQMFANTETEIQDNNKNWNKIRKKSIKQNIIEKYSIEMKRKYKLTNIQVKKLFSIIIIGLIFKTITIEHISYSDGEIRNIDSISFQENKIEISPDLYNFNSVSSPEIIINEKNMSDHWKKYLKLNRNK